MAFKPSFDPKTGRMKILVRLSYCNILRKTASVEGGSLKYRTNGMMNKSTADGKASIRVVNEAVGALIKEKWPGKDVAKFTAALKDRAPLYDGDEYTTEDGDPREHYEGQKFLKLTSDKKPKLKLRNGQDCEEEEKDELFKSGFWAIAYAHLYPMTDKAKGGNGIFTTLDALQYYKRDEEFAGGGIDDDEIDDLGDEDDMDDEEEKPAKAKPKSRASSVDDDDDDI